MNKTQLLADLEAENKGWEELLAQIGEARMTEPGVAATWSTKDIVAHLSGWRRRTAARLRAASENGTDPAPPWPAHLKTDDEINAWIYEQNKDRALKEVLADSRLLFRQLYDAISALPESTLSDPARLPWLEGQPLTAAGLFAHFHDEHEPDMRAWLATHTGSR